MPSGGIQSAGSGLQLQQQTPGTPQKGNTNVNGTMLATRFGTDPLRSNKSIQLFGDLAYTGTPMFNSTTAFGSGFSLDLVISGGVYIGAGLLLTAPQQNVVAIGASASPQGSRAVCIGAGTQADTDSTALGSGCNVVGASIGIGSGVTVVGGNSIGIGNNCNGPNQVRIGNSLQSDVLVGAYKLSNFKGAGFLSTASVTIQNTVAPTSIIPGGNGSLSFAAGSLAVGTRLTFETWGELSTDAAAPTVGFSLNVNGNSESVATIPASFASLSQAQVRLVVETEILTTGATGTARARGYVEVADSTGQTHRFTFALPAFAIDTTAPAAFDLVLTFGAAAAANIYQSDSVTLSRVG